MAAQDDQAPVMAEATSKAETFHRHGDPDPSKWNEAEAVTGRPADIPPVNSTMADRAKARQGGAKQVDAEQVEDKAVKKAPVKKAAANKKAPVKKAAANKAQG